MNPFIWHFSRRTAEQIRRLTLALVVVVALVLVGWLIWPWHRITYNVTLRTEWLEFLHRDISPVSWPITGAEVFGANTGGTPFTGVFEPADSVRVVVERVAFGPLVMEVQSARADAASASVGVLRAEDDTEAITAGAYLSLVVTDLPRRAEAGTTLLLPLVGEVQRGGRLIGRTASGSTAILRSGTVQMLGQSIGWHRAFDAGETSLNPGDVFEVEGTRTETEPALGFVQVDERPGMLVAYRVLATQGWVRRPGGGRHRLSVSLFSRLARDPFFGFISLVSALIVVTGGVATIALFWVEWSGSRTTTRPESE